jgi:hypothetical protein
MNIPKTIMQTWKDNISLNTNMKKAIQTWKDKNPNYIHNIMYDKDCKYFLKKYFTEDVLQAFNTIKSGAGKADLFRYCYLYIKGGIYVDVDNICIKPLDEWLKNDDKFVGILDLPCKVPGKFFNKHFSIHQSFIAVEPGNKSMWYAFKLTTYNILNQVKPISKANYLPQSMHPIIKISGPKLLADAIVMSLNNKFNKTFILKEKCDNYGYRFPAQVFIEAREKYHNKYYKSIIKDNFNNTLIQMKYNGYNPDNYWTNDEKLYN